MENAIAYPRYSSGNQNEASIDAQLRAIRDYAEKNNFRIIKVYADKAKTATTDHRPAFQQMIADSASGAFQVVIVHKMDRFARNRKDAALYKYILKRNNVRVVSVLEHLDDSPESVVLESLLDGMAEYFSLNLAREVMKGMKETALQAQHTGGLPPLGYDVDQTKHYVINEEEAKIVKGIFQMYLEGHGYSEILHSLKGFKTKAGNPFGKNSLHDILANEKYCGIYVFNKASSKREDGTRNNHDWKQEQDMIRIPSGMPQIISKDDFETVRKKMAANKHRSGAYRAKEIYLLSGLIFCGECGHAMVGNVKYSGRKKAKYVTYRCGDRDRTKTCKNKDIRREYVEKFVLQQLVERIFSEKNIPDLLSGLNEFQQKSNQKTREQAKAITAQLKKTHNQINNIVNAITDGFASETLKEKLSAMETKKAELEISLRQSSNSKIEEISQERFSQIVAQAKKYVFEGNTIEIKKFLHQYVDKVLVYEDHVQVVFALHIIVVLFGGGEGSRTPVRKTGYKSLDRKSVV
jgi:site-specific DNA recombinase